MGLLVFQTPPSLEMQQVRLLYSQPVASGEKLITGAGLTEGEGVMSELCPLPQDPDVETLTPRHSECDRRKKSLQRGH